MSNLLKKFLNSIAKYYVKKQLTNNLGKVVEDDEKIICYVKKNKIKKKNNQYIIRCYGIEPVNKKIAKTFKLNKPICYVIENIELKKYKVYIFGYDNCEVVIKNCNFEYNLCISVTGKCILDNTNITTFSNLLITSNDLIIKNMKSYQIRVIDSESKILFYTYNKTDVIDSNIGNQKKDIYISTNKLNIVNSNIAGRQVECNSSVISADKKSSLIAADKVNLQTNKFNYIDINAPTIVLNGKEIKNTKKSVVLQKINEPLVYKRLELIDYLKKVKTQCENINSEKILKYQEELNTQPISKVLKK